MKNKIKNGQITSIAIASILLIGSFSMTMPAFAVQPPTPVITFGYDPNPVVDGDAVDMNGEVKVEGSGTSDGNLSIEQGFQDDLLVSYDNPAHNCNDVTQWMNISGNLAHPAGIYSYDGFDTTGQAGQTLVFKTHISGSGGDFKAGDSACLPLEIISSDCEGDIQIAAIDSSVYDDPENPLFSYTIKATACTDVEDLKIQGGSNGWSSIESFETTPDELGEVTEKILKRNTVYIWKIDELAEGDMAIFEVEMTPNIDISCGQTVQINGGWSVAYKLPEDNTKYKTEYTSPLTWTKTCA